ncbi:sialic acid-binding Ig-like lectin 13 [Pteronotus mesoamericanus]|uniref:sialic acid-binding Ig-like lectin 13 n=1 Tax=Pteronotus mesoamericanus TaxID=1884717 RepID=UPI0023ED9131|nr:sialic acid-binding Ig-like lectin 13 [Pteronotus parnellii mesoamericanus]
MVGAGSAPSALLSDRSLIPRQVVRRGGGRGARNPAEMLLWVLLLPLPWAGALAQDPGFQLQVPESVTVQAGLCVSVPCTVSYPQEGWTESDPAHGYWFWKGSNIKTDPPVATNIWNHKVQKKTQGRFFLRGDPRNSNCSLYIRDARESDSGQYIFRVERGDMKFSYTAYVLTVRVTALNHTPDILIPGALVSGRPTNLTCSVPCAFERDNPPTFFWTLATNSSLVPRNCSTSVLTLTPRPQDNRATLTCQVTLPGAGKTQMRTIHLNVSYPPQSVTVTAFRGSGTAPTVLQNGSSLPAAEAQPLRLVCEADSNPPAELSWMWRNWTLSTPDPRVLEVPGGLLRDGGKLTCLAQNPQGSLHVSVGLPLPRETGPGAVLWALGGAGVSTLLFLFCILVLKVRSYRKKEARAIAGPGNTGNEGAVAPARTVSQGPLVGSQPGSLVDQPPPALAVSSLKEKEEIQYATLRFQPVKPRGQEEVPENEYAEIETST